ncbi:MAG: hypothetical protein ABSC47_10920 [Terracidiphilus sp.]
MLGLLFWKKMLHRRFPAMGAYLALRVASAPVLLTLLFGQARHWFNDYCFAAYFFVYWAVYIASAVLLFFVCIEVFRSALSAFSGLMKFGVVIFRWALLASVIVSLSTINFEHRDILLIPTIAYRLMRSVSILELCLLAFLCLSMNALRLSIRDMAFGISLGFGLMSSSDFILASFWSRNTSLNDPVQFVSESVILFSLGIWWAYCALPELARKPVLMPVNSTIYRWNEIASALGHTGTQVAVPQPANSFFLTDVENVVEKVLNRNLKGRESES